MIDDVWLNIANFVLPWLSGFLTCWWLIIRAEDRHEAWLATLPREWDDDDD